MWRSILTFKYPASLRETTKPVKAFAAGNERVIHLEGARALLAVVVVVHHFILLFYPSVSIGSYNLADFQAETQPFSVVLAHSPLNIFMNGHLAVSVFLVISGYVLTLPYITSGNTNLLGKAALKRYFRLSIPVL